jgi:outer membrane protein
VDGSATVRNAATNTTFQVGQLGTSTTSVVGVTLSVPLYAGHATDNRVSETLKLEEKARHDLDSARRGVELATRQSFMGLQSLAAQVKALEAAESSSQLALESTQLGYKVGVRVNLDVLNAQSLLFQTRRDLAKARYDSILGSLRLRQAAGTLGTGDVQALAPLLRD